jgi:hypothetical protein
MCLREAMQQKHCRTHAASVHMDRCVFDSDIDGFEVIEHVRPPSHAARNPVRPAPAPRRSRPDPGRARAAINAQSAPEYPFPIIPLPLLLFPPPLPQISQLCAVLNCAMLPAILMRSGHPM